MTILVQWPGWNVGVREEWQVVNDMVEWGKWVGRGCDANSCSAAEEEGVEILCCLFVCRSSNLVGCHRLEEGIERESEVWRETGKCLIKGKEV